MKSTLVCLTTKGRILISIIRWWTRSFHWMRNKTKTATEIRVKSQNQLNSAKYLRTKCLETCQFSTSTIVIRCKTKFSSLVKEPQLPREGYKEILKPSTTTYMLWRWWPPTTNKRAKYNSIASELNMSKHTMISWTQVSTICPEKSILSKLTPPRI